MSKLRGITRGGPTCYAGSYCLLVHLQHGCREVQFTWTFFLDLTMPTRSCRNLCSSCTSPCHGTLWMGWLEILPNKIQEMPMLGQKLLSRHLYTVTINRFFLWELVHQLLVNCRQKKKSLSKTYHTVCGTYPTKQNEHRLVLSNL